MEQDLEGAGIEVGEQDGGGVELKPSSDGVAVGGDVEQVLGGVG